MVIRRLIPLLAGAVLAACSLDVSRETGNIVLYLAVDKATLDLDSSLTVTVTARNVGYNDITLTGPSDCLIYIQILNSTGVIVHTSDNNCMGETVTQVLEPGIDFIQAFPWNGTSQTGERVKNGLYAIRAIARVTGNPYLGPPLTIAVQ